MVWRELGKVWNVWRELGKVWRWFGMGLEKFGNSETSKQRSVLTLQTAQPSKQRSILTLQTAKRPNDEVLKLRLQHMAPYLCDE